MNFAIVEGQVTVLDNLGNPFSSDSFGRLRVSAPQTIFDSKQIYDNQPILFSEFTNSGGTVTYSSSRVSSILTTTTTVGSRALRQTKRYFNYQPGKSQYILVTFVGKANVANVSKKVGYFDNNDGIYFEMNGSVLQMVIRSSGPELTQTFTQANWNVDKLDGFGPSGYNLDITKAQIFAIDFEYLGVGVVRVGFVIDGVLIVCHRFLNANALGGVYMKTPNLPVRWEVENTGAPGGGDRDLEAICCTVMSEGGQDLVGQPRVAVRPFTSPLATANVLRSVITIRLKSAYNRAPILLSNLSLLSQTSGDFQWALLLNPTFASGTPSWVSVANSAVEYDISRTGQVSGGTFLFGGFMSVKSDNLQVPNLRDNLIQLASDYAGTSDELVLAAASAGATSENYVGSLGWLEL